jgi:hypothetical protein
MEVLVSVQIDFLKISYLTDFGCPTSFGTGDHLMTSSKFNFVYFSQSQTALFPEGNLEL